MVQSVERLARRGRRTGALALITRPRALWRFLRDPAAPALPKVAALLALLYVVMPFDFVTDLVPLIGWLDDLGLSAVAVAFIAAQAARYQDRSPTPR